MLIDKFVMKWTADTQEAAASIDELQAKADKFAEKAGDKLGEEFKKAAKDIADAGEKLEAAAGSAGSAKGKSQKTDKDNAKALNDAHQQGAKSSEKMQGVVGKLREMFTANKESLSNAAGGAAGGAGRFAGGIAGILPGMSGIVALGGAASLAAAALFIMTKHVSAANDRAERAMTIRKEAWDTGRSQTQYNEQVLRGKKLGLTEEETQSSLTGMADRLRAAVTNPYGEEALRFRQAKIGVGSANKPRDIEDTTQAVVKYMRALAKAKGENEGIAWATQRMGMSFQMAEAYIKATDSELAKNNIELRNQAMLLTVSQIESKKYAVAQRAVDNSMELAGNRMSKSVTPALTRFSEALAKSAKESSGLVAMLGSVTEFFIDLATGIVNFLGKVGAASSKVLDNEGDRMQANNWLRAKGVVPEREEGREDGRGTRMVYSPEQIAKAKADMEAERQAGIITKDDQGRDIGTKEGLRKSGIETLKDQYSKKVLAQDIPESEKESKLQQINAATESAEDTDLSLDDTNSILSQIFSESQKHTKELTAQTKHGTPPIPVIPVTIGLEQALSLWASGLGLGNGLTAPEGAANANTRGDYERTAKAQIAAQRDVSYNPNKLVSEEKTKNLLVREAQEVSQPLRPAKEPDASESAPTPAKSDELTDIKHALEAQAAAQRHINFTPNQVLSDQLAQRAMSGASDAAKSISPTITNVNIKQTNTVTIPLANGNATDFANKFQEVLDKSNKALVNSFSTSVS